VYCIHSSKSHMCLMACVARTPFVFIFSHSYMHPKSDLHSFNVCTLLRISSILVYFHTAIRELSYYELINHLQYEWTWRKQLSGEELDAEAEQLRLLAARKSAPPTTRNDTCP